MAENVIQEVGERKFQFGENDFERVRRLIYAHAGISLSPTRSAMVYNRLARRVSELGLTTFAEYLGMIETGDGVERQAFTNALTTNLTAFFREAYHFPVLAKHLLRPGASPPLTVWCAGSSTGEEPYSIAMTAVEAFGQDSPPVRILASDVDTSVLACAEEGIYAADRTEKLEPERLKRFFLRGTGGSVGKVRVRQTLRDLVTFRRINLLDERWPIRGGFDAIFCRNVMIYFDKPTKYAVVERFAALLKPDGLLFIGHSESLHHAVDLFTLRSKTVYGLASAGRRA